MSRKPRLDSEDKRLFREAVKDVRRLPNAGPAPWHHPPPPRPLQHEHDERQVIDDLLSDTLEPWELETGEELLFSRPGLQHSVLRKLRRGHYCIAAELDLHGLTQKEARQALSEFLHHSRLQRLHCVRIIHGKGNRSRGQIPVLKNKVNHWLQQRDEVLAFASARPVDGGTGALYVLLKRSR